MAVDLEDPDPLTAEDAELAPLFPASVAATRTDALLNRRLCATTMAQLLSQTKPSPQARRKHVALIVFLQRET